MLYVVGKVQHRPQQQNDTEAEEHSVACMFEIGVYKVDEDIDGTVGISEILANLHFEHLVVAETASDGKDNGKHIEQC